VKLGISSYTFGWAVGVRGNEPATRLDEDGLLNKCGELGVKLLQVGDNLPLHEFDERRLARLAERAAREGVELEVGARRLTLERVTIYTRIARRLGVKLVRIIIDDAGYHPAPDEIIAVLRRCAALLEGLTLGIENHDRLPAVVLREIIEAAGSERIGVCLDTANSLGAGEGIEHVSSVLAPLTVNLHIKDFGVQRAAHLMGFEVSGRPAGEGLLNVDSVLKKLAPFNRCATAVLELWTPPESSIAETIAKESRWARQSLTYLKQFFPESPA